MPLALISCAVLAVFISAVILTLLMTAIRRSRVDDQRLELAGARRRHRREHRATAPPRRQASWRTSPDAS
jgi:hypothetical protein